MDGVRNLEPVPDPSVGDWIGRRLAGLDGTVVSVVPRDFDAYARVLHPVECYQQPWLRWADVCRITGRVPHALMQWTAISRSTAGPVNDLTAVPDEPWRDGGGPDEGNLAPPALAALLDVLAAFTGAQGCHHALWEGWGWVDGKGVAPLVVGWTGGPPPPIPEVTPGVPPEVWALPRLRLPDRDHLLFRGPLHAALDMGWRWPPDSFRPQSPSLLWPADCSWCVGTEIDFDSTLVGGSADLIDAVLAAPDLEAWPVQPADSLRLDADHLNAPTP